MDSATFLGLRPADEGPGWAIDLHRGSCSSRGRLYGGLGLAAGAIGMERATGRPCAWATAQFLATALEGEILNVSAEADVTGRTFTQANAMCTTPGRDVVRVTGVCGGADDGVSGQWVEMPVVPPPSECDVRVMSPDSAGSMISRFEHREVPGPTGEPGVSRLWLRCEVGPIVTDVGWLALFGDFALQVVLHAMGLPLDSTVSLTSLDNTVRQARSARTEWLLLDMAAEGAAAGAVHCTTRLFGEDGTLVGIASQSGAMRLPAGT